MFIYTKSFYFISSQQLRPTMALLNRCSAAPHRQHYKHNVGCTICGKKSSHLLKKNIYVICHTFKAQIVLSLD